MRIETLIGNGINGFTQDGEFSDDSSISEPFGVTIGPDEALYFCDLGNHCVRRLDTMRNRLTTVAGNGISGSTGDGGAAVNASFKEPYEIRFDHRGNLFVVDMPAHVVRFVEVATGLITTIAGTGAPGFSGDGGAAINAQLNQPHSIELVDEFLLIADIGNHRIRSVNLENGSIATFAGTGSQEQTEDGALVKNVHLNGPRTMAKDRQGNIFLTLREGNAVYWIDAYTLRIHHVAGTGKGGYTGDGGDALLADLAGPKGIAVDADDIFIADTESHTIRVINRSSGLISTVVGDGTQHDGPNGSPLKCGLARPHGVCLDAEGRLYIGDSDNHRIRVLRNNKQ